MHRPCNWDRTGRSTCRGADRRSWGSSTIRTRSAWTVTTKRPARTSPGPASTGCRRSFSRFLRRRPISQLPRTRPSSSLRQILRRPYNTSTTEVLAQVKFTSVPTDGTLAVSGAPVSTDDEVAAEDLADLTYTPDTYFHGDDSFEWQGNSGGAYNFTGTFSIEVTPVASAARGDAPVDGHRRPADNRRPWWLLPTPTTAPRSRTSRSHP